MKFKNHIQSQINQKEVKPSHDTWNRIQARMENQPSINVIENSSKKWWTVAAVIVGLVVCTTVYFSMNSNQNSKELVKEKIDNSSVPLIKDESVNEESNKIEQDRGLEIVNSEAKNDFLNESIREAQKELVSNKSSEIKRIDESQIHQKSSLENEIQQNQKSIEIVINLDTVNTKQKKKVNYVDPNMLLYSIENKEALKENNNQKKRIAVVDLNK